jgi:hypothetical protein
VSPWWKPPESALLEPGRASLGGASRTSPEPGWRGALAALDTLLSARAPRGLRLVLSSHFTRFLMVPWDASLRRAEQAAFVQHHFAEAYGEHAAAWSYAFDARAAAGARLAIAVERALLDEARALVARRKVRLAGVRPLLATEFNRLRPRLQRELQEETFFFGLLETGRASALLVRDGEVERVVSRRAADPAADLAALLNMERLAARLPAERAPLHVVERLAA